MRKILLVLLIVLFIPLVNADDLFYSDTMELNVEQSGEILTYDVRELTLYLYVYPKEEEYSVISYINTNPRSNLEDNAYVFSWSSVDGKVDYYINSRVKNTLKIKKIKDKINFPMTVPEEYEKYTQSSELCDSDNIEIKKLANSLASGEDDAYKVIFKMTNWVNSNLNYTTAEVGDTVKASIVLKTREGACDEFSNLLMALLRSVNIPVRYITGYSYGTFEENKFGSHGWLEVWLPKYGWIPIDPTYGELGWLDTTHVKLLTTIDPMPSSVEYKWVGGNVGSGTLIEEIEVISNTMNMPIFLEGELSVEDVSLTLGSYNIIWLDIKNPNDYYVSTSAALRVAPPLIDKNPKMVFLEPFGEERVGWIVKYPANLSEGYIYTYFNNATAYFLGEKATTSIVKGDVNSLTLREVEALMTSKDGVKKGSPDVSLKILKPMQVKLGDTYTVSVSIENKGSGPLESLTVCIKEDCRNNYVGISEIIEEDFNLVASELGINKVIVTFKNVNLEPYILEINVIEKSIIERIIDFFKNLFRLK
ncbi:MAG: transglutaminase domain-containing protein [Candidatus Woesearchaeota archaeon]|nr:MAG: transglutaminase domain-containing protein [Candidatus Woesearchaeota archaeon]